MTYFNCSHIIIQVFNIHFICIQGKKFTFFVLASAYTVTSERNQKGPSAPLKLQPYGAIQICLLLLLLLLWDKNLCNC